MVARKRETDRERGREVGNYYKKSKNNDLITNLKPFWGRYWSRLYFLLQLRRVLITGATQVRPVMGGMILWSTPTHPTPVCTTRTASATSSANPRSSEVLSNAVLGGHLLLPLLFHISVLFDALLEQGCTNPRRLNCIMFIVQLLLYATPALTFKHPVYAHPEMNIWQVRPRCEHSPNWNVRRIW